MMREGRNLIFVFICILVQSLGFSGVCVGITRSNDFVQSKENTSVPNSFNVKLELSLFDQFKLKGAKIWTQTFLPLYLFLFGDKYKPTADFLQTQRYLRTR